MQNPIKGSDIDLTITITYDNGGETPIPITSGVVFNIATYDAFTSGRVRSYYPEEQYITTEGDHYKVRFAHDKQKYTGYYTVNCAVDLTTYGVGIQQVSFKNAFYLDDPIIAGQSGYTSIALSSNIETTLPALTGTLDIGLIVKSVYYDEENMIIKITFAGGTVVSIPAREIFPFRVMSEDEYEALTPSQILTNVFYYTYDAEESETPTIGPDSSHEGWYRVTFPSTWASVSSSTLTMLQGNVVQIEGNNYKLILSNS